MGSVSLLLEPLFRENAWHIWRQSGRWLDRWGDQVGMQIPGYSTCFWTSIKIRTKSSGSWELPPLLLPHFLFTTKALEVVSIGSIIVSSTLIIPLAHPSVLINDTTLDERSDRIIVHVIKNLDLSLTGHISTLPQLSIRRLIAISAPYTPRHSSGY